MMPALLTSTVGAPSSAATRSTAACDRRLVGDVGADRERPATGRLDLRDDGLAGGLVEVEDGDGEAVGGEPLRDGGADAAGGSGHDGGAVWWWSCGDSCGVGVEVRHQLGERGAG